jgi:hypothetical protein
MARAATGSAAAQANDSSGAALAPYGSVDDAEDKVVDELTSVNTAEADAAAAGAGGGTARGSGAGTAARAGMSTPERGERDTTVTSVNRVGVQMQERGSEALQRTVTFTEHSMDAVSCSSYSPPLTSSLNRTVVANLSLPLIHSLPTSPYLFPLSLVP